MSNSGATEELTGSSSAQNPNSVVVDPSNNSIPNNSIAVIPPLPIIVLPLRLLIVEFLRNCDSVLVNPVIFDITKANPTVTETDSTEEPNSLVNTSQANADSSAKDGIRGLNDESLVLDYDAYILKFVSE